MQHCGHAFRHHHPPPQYYTNGYKWVPKNLAPVVNRFANGGGEVIYSFIYFCPAPGEVASGGGGAAGSASVHVSL